jgi:hypothetical protein
VATSLDECSIDPALRNFALLDSRTRTYLRIDFGTRENYYKTLPTIMTRFFASNVFKRVFIERQIRNTPTTRLEFFLRGVIATCSPQTRLVEVPAHFKTLIAQDCFQWAYVKCKSKKRFRQALTASPQLSECINAGWTCYLLYIKRQTRRRTNKKNEEEDEKNKQVDEKNKPCQLTQFANIFLQKKFDDFVDTLLLAEYANWLCASKNHRRKSNKSKNKKENTSSASDEKNAVTL